MSRDPAEKLLRFGYAGGDPVNRSDPMGLSPFARYRAGVDRFMHTLGIGATALSLLPVTGEAMFALQLSAEGGRYFHRASDIAMIAVGAAAAFSGGLEGWRDVTPLERGTTGTEALAKRLVADSTVGIGQSVLAGFDGGRRRRFDPDALVDNLGVTAATMVGGCYVAGLGYVRYNRSPADVDREAATFHAEPAKMGEQRGAFLVRSIRSTHLNGGLPSDVLDGARLQFVGSFDERQVQDVLARTDPLQLPRERQQRAAIQHGALPTRGGYGALRANCHDHATAILAGLGR